MNQPDLGKKIAELRKAKGLTQEELVEECNLSVRTLQRIESGEVMPRSYTLRIIFTALDYSGNDSFEVDQTGIIKPGIFGKVFRYVLDLFNFKTNKMKKITILSLTLFLTFAGLFVLCSETKAQKAQKAINAIEQSQEKINKWINTEQVDSIMTFYRDDACTLPSFNSKNEIREMIINALNQGYKLIEFKTLSISVCDSIAVQKYYDVFEYGGERIQQKGMTEWRRTNGKWLIVNDIMTNY